jgi:hypothetical protein
MSNHVDFLDAKFRPEDPLRKVANVQNMNRIGNILNNIQGLGCTIVKNIGDNGLGWIIKVDGSSDVEPDTETHVQITDRYVQVNAADEPGYLEDKIWRTDSSAYSDTADLAVSWDTVADTNTGTRQRLHVKLGWITNPTHVVGMDSTGAIGWVATTDTCAE